MGENWSRSPSLSAIKSELACLVALSSESFEKAEYLARLVFNMEKSG